MGDPGLEAKNRVIGLKQTLRAIQQNKACIIYLANDVDDHILKKIKIAEPSIEFLQDPEKGVSCGIYVKGNIPIESSNGEMYETRNRVMLCRCGESSNKPFCDATHVSAKYLDQE